jgi:hypothetical protein
MRPDAALSDALWELDEAHAAVKDLVTRRQFQRLTDAAEMIRALIAVTERPGPSAFLPSS